LVTGATGFIGRHLCRVLAGKDIELHVLGRRRPDFEAEFHAWDMASALAVESLAGIDTVFHLAGKAHALAETKQDVSEYFRINTEATEQLLRACNKQGVNRFVYFSSVKAAGDIDGVMDESVSVEATAPYGQSKRASEKLVLGGGFVSHPVVIRLSMVYGNTDKGNLPKMIQAIEAGRFPPLPEFGNRRSMVHVDDVVQAVMLAAERPEAAGKTYIVTDGQAYSTRQMYVWICEALGKSVPLWHVPVGVLKVLAYGGDVIGKLRGKRFVFDSDALEKLTGSACYSPGKIQHELGFKPRHDLHASMLEVVSFLKLK